MSKKKAKTKRQKKSKYERTCMCCGNEVFSVKAIYECKYCGMLNGEADKLHFLKEKLVL